MIRFALFLLVALCASDAFAGPFRRVSAHNRLVAQAGITPASVGRYEGVGMSSSSHADAVRNACYWGQKTPVSIQYSKQGNRYYAVVRYQ